ncbi:non-ribosomal peptide synthetase, partial [Finegoldia magna]
MVPQYYERISSIPININGKVDKKKLQKPETKSKDNIVLPRTEMEKNVSMIWEEVLNISPISVKDSFMNLGGDSIKMVKVLSEMTKILGIKISFKEFIKENSIEKISFLLERKTSNSKSNIYPYMRHNSDNEYEEFPLTDVQMAYLLGRDEKFALGGVSTHGYYEILTKLDIKTLEINLNRLIQKQPMLRTIINDKGKQQMLKNVPYYKIKTTDLTSLDVKDVNKEIINERKRMSHHVFDVSEWPLFEFKAFKISESEYYLFIGIDLLIADGSSMRILVKGLLDNDIKTSTNLFNYKDYVEALEDFKNSETYSDDKKYWENKILSLPSSPGLPLKGSINEIIKPYFKRCESVVGNELWTRIKSISRSEGITVSSLLYSAYAYILGYWSNQPELTVNVTVFTRYPFNENVNNIIGDFTSVILVDSDVKNVTNFWDFAKKSQKNMLEALEHRHYDGINVIREIKKKKGLQNQAIMPVVFTSLLFSMDEEDNSTINDLGEIKMGVSQTSQVYLDYQVMETKEGLSVTWDYVEELFDESMINQMFNQYISLIESLAGENVVYPSLSDRDNSLVKSYNETEEDIPSTTVQDEFSKIVEKYPDKVIVKDKNGGITCKELDEKSAQICNFLLEKGIQQGDVVAVLGERKKETIINILGILKSGAAYVAIDPDHPLERQKYILKNSGSSLYIDKDFYERNSISNYSSANPQIEYDPSELAYIIYTSGSTGKPKGVAITHEAAMNTVIDINRKFSVDKEDKIIGLSSMCFDLSVYDIFGSLTTGATLVEIPDIHDMHYVSEIIEQEGITIWNSVPAVMDMLVSNNEIQNKDLEIDSDDIIDVKLEESSLRLVLLSGDWIPVSLPEKIKEQYENAEVISLGGATEASIWSIYYPIDKVDASWKSIPYGKPLANQEYYVLNYDLEDCPVGVAGELYIGGKGLAREYYRDEEKTKSAFINHSKYGRLYKTGDYGVMNRDGNIIFLGRKDYQVKIGGHRIELGEIENQLMKYEKVSNCTVVDWENDDGQKYLCAYIVSNEDFESEEMSKFLSLSLPEYMVPQYYERISSIPININGKVDKKKLQKPETKSKDNIVLPRTEMEKNVSMIWEEVLNISPISVKDSFMNLGGDSIKIVKIMSLISERFNLKIPYRDFLKYDTIEELTKFIIKKSEKSEKTESAEQRIYKYYEHNSDNEYEEFPLTDVQMAYLLGRDEKFALGGVSTHGYYEILTDMDISLLEYRLNKIIKSQSMFRTLFSPKGTQKVLKDIPYYKIVVEDVQICPKEVLKTKIINERKRMSHHVFDVSEWPLFEFKAFKISESEYYLFIGIDLLIADGSSMRILVKGLLENNDEISKNLFNYKDYVEALEDFKNSETYLDDKKYWYDKISLLPPAPELLLKRSIDEINRPHFRRCENIISNELWHKIKYIAKSKGITVSSLLYSAYAYILGYWSNQPELTLNVTVFTRYPFNENVNNIIGDFTSVILVDTNVRDVINFWDFAKNSQDKMFEALEHRHYDGINVIREIKKQKGLQDQAIMPVVFTSLLFSMDNDDNSTINDLGEIKMGVSQTSQVYLDYQVMETKEGLSITWDYVEELFDESMINQMFNQYISLVESLAGENIAYPDLSVHDSNLVKTYNETKEEIPSTTVQ